MDKEAKIKCLEVLIFQAFYDTIFLEFKGEKRANVIRRSNKKFIFSDKLYVGSSAGSCICSPNLEIYKTLDDQQKAPNIKSLEGLNVIDFEIIPHYGRDKYADRHKEIIEKYKSKYKLLTLEDKESILFKSRDTYKLIE